MGCVSSKQHQRVCQKCQTPYFPASMKVHHRIKFMSSSRKTKSDIIINPNEDALGIPMKKKEGQQKVMNEVIMDFPFPIAVIEAKNWSKMIENKIPKILPKTPDQGEVETINTWELMEGLEDNSPPPPADDLPSISFDPLEEEEEDKQSSDSKSVTSELDAEEITSFRRTLEELNPANPFHLNPLDSTEESKKTSKEKERVVLYFTSLRGIRKTYKDCCHVRTALRDLGFRVDERDLWMHSVFKDELTEFSREGAIQLPMVFAGKKYIGGADEIRNLQEEGELEKLLEGCERWGSKRGGVCKGCGDVGFIPCDTCSGSCKIYYEHDEDYYYRVDCDEGDYGFQRCPDCNENGLVRCPVCCD